MQLPTDFGAGERPPRITVRQVAENLSRGEMLLRRGVGFWIDIFVLAALVYGPVFALRKTLVGAEPAVWIGVGLALLYFPVTEGRWGRSLGKLITGTVVVRADGRMPGYGWTVVRTLLRLIEANPFLFGALPAVVVLLATRDRRRLGDMASGTFVIPHSELRYVRVDEAPVEVFD